jgi:hypothetical protein
VETLKWITDKYNVLSILFSIVTLGLITLTIPAVNKDPNELFELSRDLIISVGAGFFGLLGFIVGGFAISSSKTVELLKDIKIPEQKDLEYFDSLYLKEIKRFTNRFIHSHLEYLLTYKSTVKLLIFNIIATFLIFIITSIPMGFSLVLFWICTIIVVSSFYFAIFYTLKLFTLGLKPIQQEWMKVHTTFEQQVREFEWDYQEFDQDKRYK